jgi:outer membrane protein assembly factor BamD (BamD/ComL family)
MTLNTDRDQTKTKETIALARDYLEKEDLYTTYAQDVQQIQHASYVKLIECDKEVIAFYLRRNKHKAAENRLAHIKDNYLKYAQEFEPDILKLEIQVADAQGYTGLAEQKRTELATRFSEREKTQLAHNSQTKTDHVARF